MKSFVKVMPMFLFALVLVFAGCNIQINVKDDKPANTSASNPRNLTVGGSWFDGEINVIGNEVWFSFDIENTTEYTVEWRDRDNSGGTCDITVSLRYYDDTTWPAGYEFISGNSKTFTSGKTGKMLIKVQAVLSYGTFSIRVRQ